ncbi:hypothetical protein A9Q81_00670 [Gammaproteobacteria bacterium 42_54_T18]|nr:hypothetical protein A9Q81_00670 [Gammaproteobacteria bacterium 42_54_T18]
MEVTESRDASDRYTVEIYDLPVWKYSWLKWRLSRIFRLKSRERTIISLDERFQQLGSDEGEVSIEWDIWSGFIVVSIDKYSENLVIKIRDYLKSKYE